MFLPINDDTPRYRMQYVTFGIIAVNVVVFAYQCTLGERAHDDFLQQYASLPNSHNPVRALTSGFLHADIIHLLGNMWFLFLFGSSVEGKLGHHWMAAIYTVCLFMSDVAEHLFAPLLYNVSFGASGAVGGMVGAYWFLFSRAKVDFFYLITIRVWGTVTLSIHWAVVWLFGWDVVMHIVEKYYHFQTGVSNTAHLGGVASGLICGFLLRRFTHVILDGDDMYTRTVVWWRRRKASAAYFARPRGESEARPIEEHQPIPPSPNPFPENVLDDPSVPERIPFPADDPPQSSSTSTHGVKELPLD